jgi:hypothetical protein
MKATITRVGDTITRIRFEREGSSLIQQYNAILADLPDDKAKRGWLVRKQNIRVSADGWVEVTPR